MKPSEVSSRLRLIASGISRSSKPDRARVASAVRSVLAGMEGGKAFVHMSIDPADIPGLDPDGKLAAEFSKAVASYGGSIENWEGEWLEIEVPRPGLPKMIAGLDEIGSGKHGPGARKIAEAYSVDEVYGDDGEGNPGEPLDPSEYGGDT